MAVSLLAACSHDGRTLRPAAPDQVASISTPSTATTAGAGGGGGGGGASHVGSNTSLAATSGPLAVTAPWAPGGPIDRQYTCDGINVSPALSWSPAPSGTAEIAISVVDDEADFAHWVVAGLDAAAVHLDQGNVPLTASQAVNSGGIAGWSGPCGQPGTTHTYRVTVWYLGQQTELGDGAPADDMLTSMRASAIASTDITGTYHRT